MTQIPPDTPREQLGDDDVQAIDRLRDAYARLRGELARVIVGQEAVIERLAVCLFPDVTDPELSFLRQGSPADTAWRIALGERLIQHQLCQRTLKIIAARGGPAPLETIASGLAQVRVLREWSDADHRALAELVVALLLFGA